MIIRSGLFASGVLLLLFPADRLLSRLVELRSFDCFQSLENSPRYRPWWWVPLLWLDPVRAFVGAGWLSASLLEPASEWETTPKSSYALLLGVLCASIVCQMLTRREQDALLAPLGFVAGIVAAFTPWAVAAGGVTMALTGMFAFRSFPAFFVVGLGAVAFLGLVLGVSPVWLLPPLVALALPGVVGAVSGRALEIPTRDTSEPLRSVGWKP